MAFAPDREDWIERFASQIVTRTEEAEVFRDAVHIFFVDLIESETLREIKLDANLVAGLEAIGVE